MSLRLPVGQQDFAQTRSVIAIDFGGSKVALALFDASGSIAKHMRVPIAEGDTAQAVLHEVIAQAAKLLAQDRTAVIGAVSPGVILDDRILLAPNVVGWPEVALARQLSEGLDGCAVFVGNDVKAAAAVESTLGNLHGCDPGLYLNLGTGIAAALVVNGVVIQGAHGASGEIGYNSAINNINANRATSLEEVVGSRALVRRAQEVGFDYVEPREVFASTATPCVRVVADFLDEVAVHLRHIVHLVDPARIVLGGGLIGSADVIIPGLLARLSVKTRPVPDVCVSAFGAQASLHGACLVALVGAKESEGTC